MIPHRPRPVNSFDNLKDRVGRLFRTTTRLSNGQSQLLLDLPLTPNLKSAINNPTKSIAEFLNFITDAVPDGDVYLFGGVLRDLALIGQEGFNSDIDIVVEGNWSNCVTYLESLGALKTHKNKFGGYRLEVAGWPVDIWNAKETWAIKQGLVQYKSIASLTETTVLNWDAILMNWRTKIFVCRENYLEEIKSRVLNIVLEENPDPLGMAVRVLRHLCLKDAKKVTLSAVKYLANCTKTYSYEEIKNREIRSYGNSVIEPPMYRFFEHLKTYENLDSHSRYSVVIDILKKELELV